MADPRITKLAEVLIDHSCQLKKGERVLIEAIDMPSPELVCRLVELAAARGAQPLVNWKSNTVMRSIYGNASEEALSLAAELEANAMKKVACYIGIRGGQNSSEFVDVPAEKMAAYQKLWWHPVHGKIRVPDTRWVVLRYPTPAFAQAADMSTEAFENFYFDVCTADYVKMAKDQEPLVKRMNAADKVRLVGPGTDLNFSIKGIPARACHGQRNIPDGEVFTAPVRDSLNGVIRYNAPSRYQGVVFENITFTFKNGKIVDATAQSHTDKLNKILDSDEGARYIGEWSIGCNNFIRRPMLDTLFDEKIGGSIHLTPGSAYDDADNGNRSVVHWDLVHIQLPEYGGGEIWFDDELLRKDGKFIPKDLLGLNAGL